MEWCILLKLFFIYFYIRIKKNNQIIKKTKAYLKVINLNINYQFFFKIKKYAFLILLIKNQKIYELNQDLMSFVQNFLKTIHFKEIQFNFFLI